MAETGRNRTSGEALVVGPRVRCVGELMTDVVAQLPAELAPASDTRASVRLTGGGAAANTATWLATLDVPVALTARVGADAAGSALLDGLRRRGIDIDAVEIDPDRPTGACLVLVDHLGERTMVPDAGANSALHEVAARPGEHLHVSAYALFHPDVRAVVVGAVRRAVDAGATVSVDLASAAPLRHVGPDVVREWCEGVLVLANLDEARTVTGRGEPAAAAQVLAQWGRAAVVKAGPAGAWCAVDDHVQRVPVAESVANPADTTGAGDAFAAGLLAALLNETTLEQGVVCGHRVAVRAIAQIGAQPGLDDHRERRGHVAATERPNQ